MPSLGDSALIFFLALLLFGPKKLPELARQLGKLMGEFRRASNEFRMQMEEELRTSEQEERQKKIAALEAAAPVSPSSSPGTSAIDESGAPALPESTYATIADPLDTHPHMIPADAPLTPQPVPIATSGELDMMPPATGLPIGRSGGSGNLAPLLQTIPKERDPELPAPPDRKTNALPAAMPEAQLHG